ncbi:MAG: ABC transporter ATP-binding protein [Nitrospirae bacterium]|jgi:phospholipid/cholesterol/gamma-HCH transport system ATP-binding protein|nr:ABC transporter ATP-binding protein [Nitrospirota bacterium]
MIEIINLHKSFGKHKVLKGIDLEVEKGESMVVIGGSGSGKSVLLKHIIGILKPDEGNILINSTDITTLKEKELYEIRKKFGMLFQMSALFDSMCVWENVGFALMRHKKLNEKEAKAVAIEKLRLVGLVGVEDLMPAELSGGMKKRVGLARAIAHEPEILLYDEPTTGLDPIMADAINELVAEMKKHLSVTSVAITHDMNSAYKIGDRIAVLYDGKIIEVGTPDQIKNTENPVVKQFITGSASGPIKIEGVNYERAFN